MELVKSFPSFILFNHIRVTHNFVDALGNNDGEKSVLKSHNQHMNIKRPILGLSKALTHRKTTS